MPSADSRPTLRMDRSILSHAAVTCGGSPEVSSTAFDAQPPDLPPVCLVETGFAVLCQLAPHRRPHHPVLVHRLAPLIHASFRPRLATTPLRFSSPSPPPGWAGDFHPLAVEHVRHTKQKAARGGLQVARMFSNELVQKSETPSSGFLWNLIIDYAFRVLRRAAFFGPKRRPQHSTPTPSL
jgi:hypothetical protein